MNLDNIFCYVAVLLIVILGSGFFYYVWKSLKKIDERLTVLEYQQQINENQLNELKQWKKQRGEILNQLRQDIDNLKAKMNEQSKPNPSMGQSSPPPAPPMPNYPKQEPEKPKQQPMKPEKQLNKNQKTHDELLKEALNKRRKAMEGN